MPSCRQLKLAGLKEGPEVRREKGIPSWEPDMKPRERLLAHGPLALSDAELLAMLIGSGTPRETAVDLAERILKAFGGLQGWLAQPTKDLPVSPGWVLPKTVLYFQRRD
jgi:DNA repair protein RadC